MSVNLARKNKMNDKKPEAYKKGRQDFYGRDFEVTPDVLIPRPETEAAIDEVKMLAGRPYLSGMKVPTRELSQKPLILDIGTGSGCIAVTLKLEIPEAKIIGVDISEKALNVARNNDDKLGVEVDFIHSDLLCDYHGEKPDVIVANLPYVDEEWKWLDKEALSFEPSLALYAGKQGLELIFALINQVKEMCGIEDAHKNNKRWLILEADPCQHNKIIGFAVEHGFLHEKTNGFVLVFSR